MALWEFPASIPDLTTTLLQTTKMKVIIHQYQLPEIDLAQILQEYVTMTGEKVEHGLTVANNKIHLHSRTIEQPGDKEELGFFYNPDDYLFKIILEIELSTETYEDYNELVGDQFRVLDQDSFQGFTSTSRREAA